MNFLKPMMIALLGMGLAACEEEQEAAEIETIRSIKYMVLDRRSGEQERRIAGQVIASVTSNVGFETSGQIIELLRKAGDRVEEGELIARLDPEPNQLQLNQSKNNLDQALATLDDAQKKFEQQKRLLDQGFATRTAFDSAEATFKNAQGAVGVAESQLDLARRDLIKTDLKAPFAGVIARRDVQVFEEVTGGQTIYAMQTAGKDKIEASLPETLINQTSLGSEVEVRFPPLGDVSVTATVDEIAPLAGDANAYPIELTLLQTPPGLRPGMSAELVFRFATETTGKAFLIPMAAIKPNVGGGEASIFAFDQDSGTLSEQPVQITNVENNNLEILGDFEAGTIIATAGVSFLHDGMKVTLFDPAILN